MRLYYYPPAAAGAARKVQTYPIGIGREDWPTPLGLAKITEKVANPTWHPPASVRAEHARNGDPLPAVVPPGPDNPLGKHAMRLSKPGYLLHGTHKPAGVGMTVSHGCIRMFPEDIETLFNIVPIGTQVRIVEQNYKVGWLGNTLFLEMHPPPEDSSKREKFRDVTPLVEKLFAAIAQRPGTRLDWNKVEEIAANPLGIPIPVSIASSDSDTEMAGALPLGHPEPF
jgi:L,D-transpeptidase ErfK/SrfK